MMYLSPSIITTFGLTALGLIALCVLLGRALASARRKLKEDNMHSAQQMRHIRVLERKIKCDGKPFREAFEVPPEFTLAEDGKPAYLDGSRGGLLVYVTRKGHCYHTEHCQHRSDAHPVYLWDVPFPDFLPCSKCNAPFNPFDWYKKYMALVHEMNGCDAIVSLKDGIVQIEDNFQCYP